MISELLTPCPTIAITLKQCRISAVSSEEQTPIELEKISVVELGLRYLENNTELLENIFFSIYFYLF